MAVTVAISLRNYINLNEQFDRHLQTTHERYAKEVKALLQQSLDRLRQIGSLIPSLPGIAPGLANGDGATLERAVAPQWPILQVDLSVDVLGFYDTASRPLAHWRVSEWAEEQSAQTLAWVRQVNTSEKPISALRCDPECRQYAIVPILAGGVHVGVVLVGSSVTDLVLTTSQISENDIGMLVRRGKQNTPSELEPQITQWHTSVAALTHVERNLNLLKQAAHSEAFSSLIKGIRYPVAGHTYELRALSLSEVTGDESIYLVVIADITDTLMEIRKAAQEIFLVGGVGWLLAEALLLAILWTPMARLRSTVNSLPLLAQRKFQTVRTALHVQAGHRVFRDELDVLNTTTLELTDRLEQLEGQVLEHTQALSLRMEELAQERNFVTHLLNAAQVMILTQDRKGHILMANPFTQLLTGYQETELLGQSFKSLLHAEQYSENSQRISKELVYGKHAHIRHESRVVCKDGSIRNVTWHHSRLTEAQSENAAILSVGLDITERLGAETKLAWLADHDPLTGLINRRRFQDELAPLVNAAKRHDRTGALLLIDLDQFKYINDTEGHDHGDTLLKLVAKQLTSAALVGDVVARMGSDEFALVLQEADVEGAVQLAMAVNALLGTIDFTVGGMKLVISAAIGITLFPTHGDSVIDLQTNADLAVNQAKEKGYGQWHMYSGQDAILEKLQRHIYWKDRVSNALRDDSFFLYFQPIMEIASGRISHYEVLLRLQSEDGTVIGPADFIDAAERSGLIYAVDRAVIHKALQFLAVLQAHGQDVHLSVNLSAHAFRDPVLPDYINQELRRSGVEAKRLIFEITETAAVADFALANSLILAIKELGCCFALDDFGIGFSSFYYLKHLPVDILKIDGSFIRQLADSLEDQIIVQAMSQVAAGFGKKTTAEFVETSAILDLLRDYGIDYAQGYLIDRPLSSQEVLRRATISTCT
ncbi:MAG: EAL domain-containing protein [Gammaproteobacteria bacterium]|nr:EAL domain-containing protein [Gammaproteobacteria bacterium]MCP5424361.1 EAL domain-containing protein [Gammaproteobacteria bacterium]